MPSRVAVLSDVQLLLSPPTRAEVIEEAERLEFSG
jgi:hypothetical protein